MSPEDRVERRLINLEHAVWGIGDDDGGLVEQIRGLRRDFHEWRTADTKRREATVRAVILASSAAIVALIGTVITLVIALISIGGSQ